MFEYLKTKQETPVYLNIYNFWERPNKCCGCIGLGVYHTAIEIQGIQYMYYGFDGDQTGVIEIQPKSASYQFSEQYLLGHIQHSFYQLETDVLEPLRLQFLGNRYDLLNNNCNHFAYRMSQMLGVSQTHPYGRIFRVTDFCNWFRCCIPNCILSGRLDWFVKDEQQFLEMQQNLHDHISRPKTFNSTSSNKRKSQAREYGQLIEQEEEDIQVQRVRKPIFSHQKKDQPLNSSVHEQSQFIEDKN